MREAGDVARLPLMINRTSKKCGYCAAPNPNRRSACYACGRALGSPPAPRRARGWSKESPDRARRLVLCASVVGAVTGGVFLRGRLGPASLERAALYGRNLAGARLRGANLRSANLSQANLTRADLSGARVTGAQLAGARLSGANLSGAEGAGLNLRGADLAGANLANADLANSDLTGANLQGANLAGVNLEGAFFNRNTRWPSGFEPEAHGAAME
jgi:hypothetical protein